MIEIDKRKFIYLLKLFAPDEQLTDVEILSLGFSNRSYKIKAIGPGKLSTEYIVKQYLSHHAVFLQSAETRADLEYKILRFLREGEIPCPEPIFFAPMETPLESPILVTKVIPGKQILAHPPNPLWAEKASTIAELLAQIHLLSCSAELKELLPEATVQNTKFVETETVPDYMQEYADGEAIWHIVKQERSRMKMVDPVLVHGDYWSGNILWEEGKLTGILDWENAAIGDPGYDVAYCRMEMIVDGMYEAANTFLKTYETIIGKSVENLNLCELVMVAGLMKRRAPFLTVSPMQERVRNFVADAIAGIS